MVAQHNRACAERARATRERAGAAVPRIEMLTCSCGTAYVSATIRTSRYPLSAQRWPWHVRAQQRVPPPITDAASQGETGLVGVYTKSTN